MGVREDIPERVRRYEMEIRQEHVAEDGTVTDSKDEANKLRLDELQEQAEQNELIIAELKTDKRVLNTEVHYLWEESRKLRAENHNLRLNNLKRTEDMNIVKLLSDNGRLRDRMIEIRRILKDSEELLLP